MFGSTQRWSYPQIGPLSALILILNVSVEAALIAEYRFDALTWSGVAGEVVDSSGNGFDGVAVQTDTVDGLVCRAADLSAPGTADYLSVDHRAMDGIGNFSISLWVKSANTANKSFVSGARAAEANELIFWFPSATIFRPYFGTNWVSMRVPFIWDDRWHHLVWVRRGASNCIYVDGIRRGCGNLTAARRNIDPGGLIIGQEQDSVGGSFVASQSIRGNLDELLIFDTPLSAVQISSIYTNNLAGLNWDGAARSCPAFGATGFSIIHDGAGIYCAVERIGVRAIDGSGAPVAGYSNSVVLDTGSGRGTWSLDTGGGIFVDAVADDGLATYIFSGLDGGEAWFNLNYQAGTPLLDIEVFEAGDPGIRDSDLEGALAFAPTGFTVTANPLSNPPPSPVVDPLVARTAGSDFDVYLTAFGTTDDDPVCGVIESYVGVKPISIWQDWIDPVGGGTNATAQGAVVGSTEVGASVENLTFNNGQANITSKYKDAGRLRLNFKENSLRGATDAFVSRPASLRIVNIETAAGVPNPSSTTATGPGFVPAGEGYVVGVDVLDAEGDRTPNFGNEAAAERLNVVADNLVLPAGGRLGSGDDGVLGNGSAFVASATGGRFTNNTVFFDEVGIIQMRAELADGDYLGSGAVAGQLTANVGRFYPDHFALTASALGSACGLFAYMSAPHIDVQANLFARAVAGTTTQNYDTTLLGTTAVGALTAVAEHLDNGIDLGSRLSLPDSVWLAGNYVLNTTVGVFARLASADGAYEALTVGLQVMDSLDNRVLNVLDMDAASSGTCTLGNNCSAREIGDLDIYYGRLLVLPAQGPENEPLAVDLEAQIYRGDAFVEHSGDQCSLYLGADAVLSNFRDNLAAGETVITGPGLSATLLQGHTDPAVPLQLSAPGFGNEGLVEVELQVPAWLRYDWSGSGDEDPQADATFGRYRGNDRIIFWQQDP